MTALSSLTPSIDRLYGEAATTLGVSEPACRQYVSRARIHLASERARFKVAPRAEVELMDRFGEAMAAGDLGRLVALLAPDARLVSNGGGKAIAALNVVASADRVARFFLGISRKAPAHLRWAPMTLNGALAIVGEGAGQIYGVLNIATDGDRITSILVQRNPDKLARVMIN